MTDQYALDVIAIGRSSVDLYGQQVGGRLEDMASFAKYIGGCPANIAVGTARLGLKSALISRVGNDHFGRFISQQLAAEGVCVDGIISDSERLTALAILGIRDQDHFPLLFYRENCADMALCENDIDEQFIQSSRAVLITGTHLSTPTVAAASKKAIRLAKAAGGKVILDGDYRPVLWGLTAPDLGEQRVIENPSVTRQLQAVLPDCDLIVGTEEELHILGGDTDTLRAIRVIRSLSSATIVCKLGDKGCVVFAADIPQSLDQGIGHSGFPIDVFNVLGAGDAFISGFLRGWLRQLPLQECCRLANAAGALVVSRHGCAPAIPSWREMQYFLEQGSPHKALRHDHRLEQIHWSTNRSNQRDNIMVLAIDHRSQFEEMVERVCDDKTLGLRRVPAFKQLAFEAVSELARGDRSYGFLADSRFAMSTLQQAADHPYWIGRPIEQPGSIPLAFEGSADVATELNEWPLNHVVKCLCFYHPDDSDALKTRQDRQLLRLFDACRKTRHELLLEIICSQTGEIQTDTVADVIEHIYRLGVYPDWWKLEPQRDAAAWQSIQTTIQRYDPYCRGIVLLGLSAPAQQLIDSFQLAAQFPLIKGFAVGRTIFATPAQQWLSGKIDDAGARAMLKDNFSHLADAWKTAKNNQPTPDDCTAQ